MGDAIGFKMFTEPFKVGIADKEKRMDRAAMWAVREAGRTARRAASAAAPVLKDKTKQSHRQLQRRKKQGEDVSGAYQQAVPGLLKASIRPSRMIKHGIGSYSVKVGPRGPRVHLYAGKAEQRKPYMEVGEAAARAALEAVAREAFGRVWR